MKKRKKPTGKKPQAHQDVPPGWRDRLEDFCRTNWQKHAKPGEAFDLAAFTGISRKTLFNANKNNWFTKSMFANLAQAVGCGTQAELRNILSGRSNADSAPLGFPLFRAEIRPWQEIALGERPWPFPSPGSCAVPPFPPKAETDYVSACKILLKALVRYDLKPVICPQPDWQEIEIVLYQCLRLDTSGDHLWMRMASFGAVSGGKGPSQITPEGEHWLVTCWGKHRIARDEPWWPFVPIDCTLDKTRRKLTASFAPTAQHGVVAVLEMLADNEGTH